MSNLQYNILVTDRGHACLADFGLSRMIDNGTVAFTGSQSIDSKFAGTPAWMAPELHRGEKATFKSDIYAFACVCYEVCLKVDSEFYIYE